MKKFIFTVMMIFVFVAMLLYGKYEYDQKLKATSQLAQAEIQQYQVKLEEERKLEAEQQRQRVEKLVRNLQMPLKDKVIASLENKEPLQVVAMGSRALTGVDDISPWPELFQDLVNDAYGQKLFQVTTLAYGTSNTFDIVPNKKHMEAAQLKPDIIILEPFIWNNNGFARIEDTLYHIGVMVRDLKRENEDMAIFIQPPNPIFGASFYGEQVETVKQYCLENNLVFHDHWQTWPDLNDVKLKQYLLADDNIPNQEGHNLWATSLVKTFAAN
ncbi:MAG: SGNH/GDSL hydrolase family protein [Anaerobacillus sp.]|uniref:SGNH/GDSL hydrolase family protein n=1 Tax=Anaerobacillus sp. TaxID=1872506 RepID=UPI003918B1A1